MSEIDSNYLHTGVNGIFETVDEFQQFWRFPNNDFIKNATSTTRNTSEQNVCIFVKSMSLLQHNSNGTNVNTNQNENGRIFHTEWMGFR